MSKETTPMQELIKWSQKDLEIFCEDSDEALRIFKAIKDKATELLEKEKQMVVDAYNKGGDETDDWHSNPCIETITAEQYYNEKFNQALRLHAKLKRG